MNRVFAKIIKKNNKFCVVSKDGKKNLGCYDSENSAKERLRQVEYFKNMKKTKSNIEEALASFAGNLRPTAIDRPSNEPSSVTPKEVDINLSAPSLPSFAPKGTVAGRQSEKILDTRDHFPAITEDQAHSSMRRVLSMTDTPCWYSGSLSDLRNEVYMGIRANHPNLELKISTDVERVLALSDGMTEPETKVEDPNEGLVNHVRKDMRPDLSKVENKNNIKHIEKTLSTEGKSIAADILQNIEDAKVRLEQEFKTNTGKLASLEKAAKKLMKTGITGEQFAALDSYVQHEILRFMASRSQAARNTLISKLKK